MSPNRQRRAFALPLVLWSIAFMAGLLVLLSGLVSDWMDSESRAERRFVARQMALSGIALGLNPALKAGDPLLRSGNPDGEGYEVRIGNEAAKINPNFWIQQGNRPLFLKLFEGWGVDMMEAEAAIDGLTDWIDGDDFLSLKGAERGEYERAGRPGFPANRPLRHVREMEAVMNLSPILAAKPDWQSYFTVWYGGKISIQHAKEPVLAELAELTPPQIQSLLEVRAGVDGIEGTDDDEKFTSIEAVADFLGAGGRQRDALLNFFDTSGDIRRIESTGFCHGVRHQIIVVAPAGSPGQIMSWEEK
ncbi:MAG: general secretion pathway protein GspK [Verrucomicrobiota bacterium]